ncbi:MarR family transcriptional regulator [Paenarthrobacter sp. CM16]|uniref:MarR family winged helix-turn-helix transcriptional regulator n=1 Tax=Paenarthrobacter sp. CM16 TaxID=2738447 RepID=UPI0015577D8A|nr:MarR family transcriptional regulator [Paenarthrobacter sp. CM16]NQD90080.1 MarR family transcriptional regulator [Paenarthrobacter sp. CM16]
MPDAEVWLTCRLLSTTARLVENMWSQKLGALGLTPPSVIALDALQASGPTTVAWLARSVRVSAQTLGPVILRLESRGYVLRRWDVFDRRRFLVSITEQGEALLEQAHDLERTVFDGLDVDTNRLREELQIIVRQVHLEPPSRAF